MEKKGQKLTKAEEKLQGQAVQTGQMIAKHGREAAVALSARKIQPQEVARILQEEKKLTDKFYELVLEAERKALSKRFN